MRISTLSSIAVLCCIYNQVMATPALCPPNIQTQQTLKSEISAMDSYTDTTDSQNVLEHVTFYDQHPKEHVNLAPDNERTGSNKLIWTFDAKKDVWVACQYANTKVQLIQKVPKDLQSCTITYEANGSRVVDVAC